MEILEMQQNIKLTNSAINKLFIEDAIEEMTEEDDSWIYNYEFPE